MRFGQGEGKPRPYKRRDFLVSLKIKTRSQDMPCYLVSVVFLLSHVNNTYLVRIPKIKTVFLEMYFDSRYPPGQLFSIQSKKEQYAYHLNA